MTVPATEGPIPPREAPALGPRTLTGALVWESGGPEGDPALPTGAARNGLRAWCRGCFGEVAAGCGVLAHTTPGFEDPHDLYYDDEGDIWVVWCGFCAWRQVYRMREGNPWPWVALGWTGEEVRAAVAAGLRPGEAAWMDPSDGVTRAAWETMAALQDRV